MRGRWRDGGAPSRERTCAIMSGERWPVWLQLPWFDKKGKQREVHRGEKMELEYFGGTLVNSTDITDSGALQSECMDDERS